MELEKSFEIFKTIIPAANPIKLLAFVRATITVRFALEQSLY